MLCAMPCIGLNKITIENPLQKSWECSAKGEAWKCVEINNGNVDLFKKGVLPMEKRKLIAEALGWVPTNRPDNICGGYYYQAPLNKKTSNEATINAQQYQYVSSGAITAEGAVEVTKGNQYLSADKAVLTPSKGKKIDQIDLTGNVNLSQPGQVVIGSQGQANISRNTATLNDSYYLIHVRQKPGGSMANLTSDEIDKKTDNFTGYAHGHADKVIQNSKTNYTLEKATYATDSSYGNDWMLGATTINLDRKLGIGKAYNTLFYVKNIPILYMPYMTFPIDDRRRTGFLYPTAGYNSTSGYYLSTPFYWNMAPNYDLLLTPAIYNHRGILFGSNFHYLTKTQQGNLDLQYMPHDSFDNIDRKAFSFTDHGYYGSSWSSYVNYQYIGDKNFYNDFDSGKVGLLMQTLLDREASISYNDTHWTFNATLQSYDVIDDMIFLANRPYSTLPQINTKAAYPGLSPHMDFNWDYQFTYFVKSVLNDVSQVEGQRYYNSPKVSFPFQKSWGFFTPSLTLSETVYTLKNRSAKSTLNFRQNQYPEQSIARALPIINIDAGLYFDRKFNLNKDSYTQSLEPRLFYTYIPYQNQSNIPLFDTSLIDFSYASIFQTNIFTGIDRINNANQLSYAFETSINDQDTGINVLSAGIGQIVYFVDRKVSLCSGTNADCSNSYMSFHDSTTSDAVAFFNYCFLPHWQLVASGAYNPKNNNFDSQTYQVQYRPNNNHVFNVAYQNIKNNYALLMPDQVSQTIAHDPLSEVTVSSIWQLTPHWTVTGLWSHVFNSRQTTNMFAGLQYEACSWAVRFLVQRYVNSPSDSNTPIQIIGSPLTKAFVVQFELKGLGGSSERSLLKRLTMIPGYTPNGGFN